MKAYKFVGDWCEIFVAWADGEHITIKEAIEDAEELVKHLRLELESAKLIETEDIDETP